MVGVVHLLDQVGDGELDLICPDAIHLALRREAEAGSEIEQDGRGLRHDHVAVLQGGDGKCKRSAAAASSNRWSSPTPPRAWATSTYSAPACSSARRTNSPRPWI